MSSGKKFGKGLPEDLKGFEEFVEGEPRESFLPKPPGQGSKKETSFENFTFLQTDGIRLSKLADLLSQKLPFAAKYEQGKVLMREQREEIRSLQRELFKVSDVAGSTYRRSLEEVFDSFFGPSSESSSKE